MTYFSLVRENINTCSCHVPSLIGFFFFLPAHTENTLGHPASLVLSGAVAAELPQPVAGLRPGGELPQLDGVESLQLGAAASHDLLQFSILGVVETARPHRGFQADVKSVGKVKQTHLEMFPELGVQFL